MAKSIIANFGTFAATDNASYFIPIAGEIKFDSGVHTARETVEIPIRTPGVLRKLRVWVASNTATVTSTVTLLVNGSDSTLVVSIGADGVGTFVDSSHDVTIAANDKVCLRITVPTETGTNTLTITTCSMEFEPTDTTKTVQIFASAGDNPSLSTDSTTRHLVPGVMSLGSAVVEANLKFRIRTTCTILGLYVYVPTNARTTDTTIGVRKNGSTTSQVATFGSGITGAQEDVADTDSFAAGDDFNLQIVTSTGGGAITFAVASVEIVSTNNTFPLCIGYAQGIAHGPGTTLFSGVAGGLDLESTTEDNAEIISPFAFTASELHYFISANTNAVSAATVTLRKNGADSALVVSVAALATGLKAETSPTSVSVAADDTLSCESDNPDPAGSITRTWIGLLATTPSSGGVIPVLENFRRQMRN